MTDAAPTDIQPPTSFLGTYTPRLDDKGRVIMPARFAAGLVDGVVMTRAPERCLLVFPKTMFEQVYAQLTAAALQGQVQRSYLRVFLAGAHDEQPDAQRRLTIPLPLRQYAGLGKDLAVIGVGDRIEIWDTQAWATYLAQAEQAYANANLPTLF